MKKLRKLIASFFVFLFGIFFFTQPQPALAQNEFDVSAEVKYQVQNSGRTLVTHDITLTNNFSTLYATTYTLSLENINAESIRSFNQDGSGYELDIQKEGEITRIKVTFNDAIVGKGKSRHFFITYENGSFATRTGEVWEVSIPRLSDESTFRDYKVMLSIPASFGLEAYMSPQPASSSLNEGGKTYIFEKKDVVGAGITAGFGEFQVFTFNLAYHLENPLNRAADTEIAIPPDTAFQRIYIQNINPRPVTVRVDEDGNWIAKYKLASRARIDVNVAGAVQIFAGYRPFPKPSAEVLSSNLKETEFWQVNDPQIKALATDLKTPKEIYNFVTTKLTYNYDRVQPNVQRLGAKSVLENPTQAICMEFTDLFIALARAAGIPAREVNGYAYTENPELQPLSLVADVLHAWPEYYDEVKGAWIPVDPTWGSTTGGEDFFNKLDLRHFAFVMHGKEATKPYAPGSYKLGPNPQKDLFVSFGKLPEERVTVPNLSVTPKRTIPFLDYLYNLKIENPGPVALYSTYPGVYFDGALSSRDYIDVLPPFAVAETEIRVPFSLLGKDTPSIVKIQVEGAQVQIPTNKTHVIVNSLFVLLFIFLITLISLLIRLKKITFGKIGDKVKKLYDRIIGKANKNNPPS